jgi:hypothetical protein
LEGEKIVVGGRVETADSETLYPLQEKSVVQARNSGPELVEEAKRRSRQMLVRGLRRMHSLIGLVSTLNILLLITTGFMIQHREELNLENRIVSRRFLPNSYRSMDVDDGVRADIVVTDLHSGRLLGKRGTLILDTLTVAWLLLVISGVLMFAMRRANGKNGVTV